MSSGAGEADVVALQELGVTEIVPKKVGMHQEIVRIVADAARLVKADADAR